MRRLVLAWLTSSLLGFVGGSMNPSSSDRDKPGDDWVFRPAKIKVLHKYRIDAEGWYSVGFLSPTGDFLPDLTVPLRQWGAIENTLDARLPLYNSDQIPATIDTYEYRGGLLVPGEMMIGFVPHEGQKVITLQDYLKAYTENPSGTPAIYNLPGEIVQEEPEPPAPGTESVSC